MKDQAKMISAEQTLPSLFGRLGNDLSRLLELRLNLLKVEVKEDVDAYVRRGVTMAIGGVIVAIGFALANVALAFFVSSMFAHTDLSQASRYGLGFLLVGVVYLIGGGIVVDLMKRRLAAQGIVPDRSIQEFEHDKQLVKSVIQS